MNSLVYESSDRSMFNIIEQCLKDNGIPCMITGAADVGIYRGAGQLVKIFVSQENEEAARDIIRQLTN